MIAPLKDQGLRKGRGYVRYGADPGAQNALHGRQRRRLIAWSRPLDGEIVPQSGSTQG